MDSAMRLQIASLLLLFYVAINYFSAKRRHTILHRLFQTMAIVAIINVTLDHLYSYISLHSQNYLGILFRAYLCTLCLLSFFMFLYISRMIREENDYVLPGGRTWYILGVLSYIFPLLPMRFEVIEGWQHARGLNVLFSYLLVLFLTIVDIYMVLKNRKALKLEIILANIFAPFSLAVSVMVQVFLWKNIVTSVGIGFMLFGMYIIIENPDQLLIEQLEFEKDRANSANVSKSAFVAHVSHEIRTPINAILGMNEMILRETKEDFTRQYAQDISNAAHNLYGIINDVLDVSKMESGKLDIYPVEYKLDKMLYDAISVNMSRIDTKQLDFVLEVNPALPNLLYGDDVRIKQALSNLLSNAVKYTHEGFIRVMVDGTFKHNMIDIKFSVKDSGIGIKEEDLSRLFVAFERIEESRNRSIEGTGLGMTITHNILRQMGSRLNITSVYGEGSIFSFTITQRIVNTEPIGDFKKYIKEQKKPIGNLFTAPAARILVVDDNALNRKVFSSLLGPTKMKIDEAGSGAECLMMIKEKHYDIIFLDHMMPEMDGIETLNKIKESKEHYNIQTPVIMLTANALGNNDETYRNAGFDAYLSKPVFIDELERTIRAYMPSHKIEEPGNEKEKKEQDFIFDLPVIRGVDWKKALTHLPTRDILMATVREFVKNIDKQADRLDSIFSNLEADDNMELMRIETHSIKSSASTIGAEVLSEGAKEIENAAAAKDVALVKEKYPYLINYYRSFTTRLEYFNTPEPKNKNIDYPQVISLFEIVKLEMNDLYIDNVKDAIEEIEVYEYPVEIQDKIERLKAYVDSFESEMVNNIADELKDDLRKMSGKL